MNASVPIRFSNTLVLTNFLNNEQSHKLDLLPGLWHQITLYFPYFHEGISHKDLED